MPSDLLMIVLLIVAFYFLVFRPVRSRQREAQAIRSALAPGQQVITVSGQYATVVSLDDDEKLTLEIAPGVRTTWAQGAIGRIVPAVDDDVPVSVDLTSADDPSSPARSEESSTGR